MPRSETHASDETGPRTGLHVERTGSGPALVLAHGFTQTHRVWGGLDTLLAADRTVTAVDLPGHGGSAEVAAGLVAGSELLGTAGGAADYLGYSMGARFCLRLALDRPDLVRRLVLVSGTAGIDGAADRAARRRADEGLAERLDPVGGGALEDTVAEFVHRWVANPIFGDVPAGANAVGERCSNTATGLASSLRLAGTGTQEPLWGRLGDLTLPVLIVTGARDAKFGELGRRLVRSLGGPSAHVVVHAADHAPHLQHPAEVAVAVRAFLDQARSG